MLILYFVCYIFDYATTGYNKCLSFFSGSVHAKCAYSSRRGCQPAAVFLWFLNSLFPRCHPQRILDRRLLGFSDSTLVPVLLVLLLKNQAPPSTLQAATVYTNHLTISSWFIRKCWSSLERPSSGRAAERRMDLAILESIGWIVIDTTPFSGIILANISNELRIALANIETNIKNRSY